MQWKLHKLNYNINISWFKHEIRSRSVGNYFNLTCFKTLTLEIQVSYQNHQQQNNIENMEEVHPRARNKHA